METPHKSSLLRRLARLGLRAGMWAVLAGTGVWSTAAIYYSNLPTAWLGGPARVIFALGLLWVLRRVRPMWRCRLVCFGAFGAVVLWFLLIPPSNDRDWQPDVAV